MVTKRLYGKDRKWSRGQKKTCRRKQHVKIDDIKEMSDLICGKAAVGGNYNSTRDSRKLRFTSCQGQSELKRRIKKNVCDNYKVCR